MALPWLGTMPGIDEAIQAGLGVVGAVVGQPFNVYRLGASTSGSVISGSPLLTNYAANVRRITTKVAIENTIFDILVYVANCDRTPLKLQDVLVTEGYESDGAIFTLAQMRPMAETLLVRTETSCFITRPGTDAGALAQQPTELVAVAKTGVAGTRISNEKYLVLASGMYSFSPTATVGASVQCGLQPLNRVRDGKLPQVPTKQPQSHHLAYVPLLPGTSLDVDDVINASNGDRYKVMESHTTGDVGFSGYIAIANRLWN